MKHSSFGLFGMVIVLIPILSGCSTSPRLGMELPIPPERISEFKSCVVPEQIERDISLLDPQKLDNRIINLPDGSNGLASVASLVGNIKTILRSHYSNQPAILVADAHLDHVAQLSFAFDDATIKDQTEALWQSLEDSFWLKPVRLIKHVEKNGNAQAEKTLNYIRHYLRAYFGDGELALLELDALHPEKWNESIAQQLNRNSSNPSNLPVDLEAAEQIKKQLIPRLRDATGTKFYTSAAKHEPGFVSRSGVRYTFPGLSGASADTVDHSQIGGDLIRIVLEAVRDSTLPLPAVSEATGVQLGLPVFNPADSYWHSTPESFMEVETRASQAETSIAGSIGKAIRGGSWGALNNEAVAKLVETAAGVIARHQMERVSWCAQKVGGLLPVSTAETPFMLQKADMK